jgi:hypothetical protein
MKEKELTAVEWLEKEVNQYGILTKGLVLNLLSQAKEMEKQQIGDAYERGFNQGYRDPEFLNTNDSDDEY